MSMFKVHKQGKPHVAFTYMSGASWTGGLHYLRNLFTAIRSLPVEEQPEIGLLVDHELTTSDLSAISGFADHIICAPRDLGFDFWQRQRNRIGKWIHIPLEPEPKVSSFLRQHHVDYVFTQREFGARFQIPLLSWIPDFQHLHLPQMFSAAEISERNHLFAQIAKHANRVILSSQHALNDVKRSLPEAVQKARILSFVAQPPADVYNGDPSVVCTKYHLPKRFVFLPNQFWRHKNHTLVLDAVAIAKSTQPNLTVVCTGNTNEYRDPTFFGSLLARISTLGIRENVIILGLVPHTDIFALMRQSLAVLQPSLFEGWSTTVEEVKSLGKRIILSDISVHCEQDAPNAIYFNPNDPDHLSDLLISIAESYRSGPDLEMETFARSRLPERTTQFGRVFMNILHEIAANAIEPHTT